MPYIAEGTYGCAFAPQLECLDNKKTPKDAIGKIFSDDQVMKEEKILSKKVQNIDPDGKWTVPFYGSCNTNVSKADPSDQIYKCKHASYLKKTEQLLFGYGGVDVQKLIEKFGSYQDLFIDDFIPMLLPLLKGLTSLHKMKMAHCDIKPANMLYNDNVKKLYIIDFGMLTSYKKVASADMDYILSWTYPYYPPEFMIYSQLHIHGNNHVNSNAVFANFDEYGRDNFFKFVSAYVDISEELDVYITKCVNNKRTFVQKFQNDYVSKIDIYSLGISFLEMAYLLSKNGLSQTRNKPLYNEFMTNILTSMIRMDADSRFTAEEAHSALEKLLKNTSVKNLRSPIKTLTNKTFTSPRIASPTKDCMKMKRDQIIDLLKKQNNQTNGKKEELCKRLDADSSRASSRASSGKKKNIATCIRQVSNMSYVKPTFLMDTKTFNPKILKLSMPRGSPKLMKLFEKIEKLDAKDMKEHKKHFKHMIFTDVASSNYGAKLIASAFVANGFTPAFTNKIALKSDDALMQTKGNNFGLLLSKTYNNKSMSSKFKKALMHKYNERPSNIQGDIMRFIILDQGFKEGIDLFDVKYIHLFEPLVSNADQKQAIGRGTRFCGQKGLMFHPRFGWPLYVFRYDVKLDKYQLPTKNINTLFELFVANSNIDLRKVVFSSEVEKAVIDASVDHQLTKSIHSFSIDLPSPILKPSSKPSSGGALKKVVKKKIPIKKTTRTKVTRIKKTTRTKVSFSTNKAKSPSKLMTNDEMQRFIAQNFKQFTYPPAKLKNLCDSPVKEGESSKVIFTPTQDFVRHYFRPESAYRGILLFHSVGSGKTCTAIATATSSFEREGYTILWVTRHTLKTDIWKNMYHQICNTIIQEKIDDGTLKLPKKITGPMRYLSDNWIEPMSYKQFSNMLLKNNKFYKEIVKKNGEDDPLKKTLVIIDEAHKLYAPNVVGSEKPRTDILEQMIENSYKVSGKDSVRVMLMTATPYTEDPMEMIKLLNILRPASYAIPCEFNEFSTKYLDTSGYFTKQGIKKFQDEIAGYVSYINRSQDGRNFAHPILENVFVDMTSAGKQLPEKYIDNKIKEDMQIIKGKRERVRDIKQQVRGAKVENKIQCKEKMDNCKQQVKTKYENEIANNKNTKENSLNKCKTVEKSQRADCKQLAMNVYKTKLEDINDEKAEGLFKCKEKTVCTALKNTNSELQSLIDELNAKKHEKEERRGLIKKTVDDNKVRRMQIKDIINIIKGLRSDRIELEVNVKKINNDLKKITDAKQKLALQTELKKHKANITNIVNMLKEERSKITNLKSDAMITKLEIGRGSLGDNSQQTALAKNCKIDIRQK